MTVVLRGLNGSDPLGFLAAIGVLRVVASRDPAARLSWEREGGWFPRLQCGTDVDPVEIAEANVEKWRRGHPALDFAVDADRKVQDLKHPPGEFRALMRNVSRDAEASSFVAAYATGVAVDGSGQTKPTSLHLTAGQQRFLDAVLNVRDEVTRDDLREALFGPWVGRVGPKDTRWRGAAERSRALLSFDPSKEKSATIVGAVWLAYQALPFFPTAPSGLRVLTTGFTGRGKREKFTWPIWTVGLTADEVRVTVGVNGLAEATQSERDARGIAAVFRASVVRSSQGYGSFSAAEPV